ncbi:hypothetical protein [Paenibacillus donghaensis]|uniref:hypothetical protein n=1 Tax=Paenibacillus donghaensis TaxID=414771 RepID=UPI001FE53647|nr:hypothetical protein [Paenibacillus donghaensis]
MAEINTLNPERTNETGELLFGRVLTPRGLITEGVVAVSDEQIHYAGEAGFLPERYSHWPAGDYETDDLLIPGFIDVHVHGGAGHDFMYSDAKALDVITAFHSSQGTTTMLATTMTADKADIDQALWVHFNLVAITVTT